MTETDLVTAGGSAEQAELPETVNTFSSPEKPDVTHQPKPADDPAPKAEDPAPKAEVTTDASKGSLSSMVLPELRALANSVGVKGASGMRKSELIAAIRESRGEAVASSTPKTAEKADAADTSGSAPTDNAAGADSGASADPGEQPQTQQRRERRTASRDAGSAGEKNKQDGGREAKDTNPDKKDKSEKNDRNKNQNQQDTKQDSGDQQGDQNNQQNRNNNSNNNNNNDDDDRGGRRGRRFRDRRRRGDRQGGGDGGGETELRDDDVVQPVAGILDVLDNYAFVRTSGYLAGPNDVYVSMNMVRKNGLRRGDAITGAVRVPKEGEGGGQNPRQKFNPLVRLDTVNGGPVEDARKRPDFTKLTPLYPNQRLRLETTPDRLTTRVIDLIMPIGKGQRALIVSPPKAGKTTILQDIANAITTNNPECHLMVVLVDERPEEVTDMTRSVKGEVIASTFDRPPSDHTQAAELAIERAKRLVEQGKDVVVLLDSITRLGRAYNNASPASGRILSGGVDSTALYPPKRFLGAARNIEDGGSLTIIATAMVETGSTGDTVIFEEFKGTGNAELKLDRKISERRVFPAVDVNPSGTRKDELLLSTDEFGVVHKLRRVLSGLDSHQAIDLLMSQLRKTKTNYEFLVQVSKTTPGSMDND